jgi:hypothetical protein
MNDERQILRTDPSILEEMVIEVEPYLMSDTIRWSKVKQERAELSIGRPIHIKARVSRVM